MKSESGSGQQINNLLNCGIRFVISCFNLAVGLVFLIWHMVEPAIGKGSAELFVEEQKQRGNLNALVGEPVNVSPAIAFDHPMGLEFSKIIAELRQAVLLCGQVEGSEDRFMNLLG